MIIIIIIIMIIIIIIKVLGCLVKAVNQGLLDNQGQPGEVASDTLIRMSSVQNF